jgi:hypothetical protein
MFSFKNFILEAWINKIQKTSKERSVTSDDKYDKPSDFKKESKKVGNIGPLEIHSEKTGSGLTHFTWNPSDRKIHHVIRASESKEVDGGKTRLKFLSAHGRDNSPVRTGDVYKHLVKHHNIEFTGTGHSPGAQKMWNKFHDDPELEVIGHHTDTNEKIKLNKNDIKYAPENAKTPEEKRIGRMHLILRKKDNT